MSLYNIISSLNLNIESRDKMYNNIKIISNYLDYSESLSKIKKNDLLNIINSLKLYLIKENEIELDIEQKLIVESNITENQRIIAGAGSGKTTTILYRIKFLLDNFITPDRILILTFNRESAQNIRNRVNKIFGFNLSLKIYTIDAFCCKLINKYNTSDNFYSLSEYCSIGLKIMKDFGKEISSQFKYIFFDEFQDVNDIQFNILKIFVDNGCYLSVVGDDCQNIYQFRGTNNYYMVNFDRIISNSKTYFLRTNYRSTNNIVEMANSSISYNQFKVDKQMKANNKKNNINPKLIINNDEYQSYSYIIDKIKDYLNNGFKYEDIAILSRNSYPLKMMETELTKYSIPHVALITDKNSDDTKKLIEPNKLVLTTIHKSKGLEWSIVFIIGLSHQHFPEHLNNNIKNIEEERRLFYVGITRCKLELVLVTNKNDFPLSIFIKETINSINIINNSDVILNDYLGGNDSEVSIKKIYGVNEIISLLNENDLEELRAKKLISNILPEVKIEYDTQLYFIDNIKKNAFESDLGEFCDRYITRGIINNLNIDFIDIDTEQIIKDNMEINDKKVTSLLCKDINNLSLERSYNYPKNIIDKIIDSYKNLKSKKKNDDIVNDIYWVSLCRNFKLERRRLIYRDISNLVEDNINSISDKYNIKKRMDNYIKLYSNDNSNCKVLVRHEFKNERKDKCYICGEIDLVYDDTIIDFKCSESEFKLEWLLQLLFYYCLLNNNSIKKLCIINIMHGFEYRFDIPEIYKIKDKQIEFISYFENKINLDQLSIRRFPSINYELLNDNKLIITKYKSKQIIFEHIDNNDNFIVLDTETAELNGDIIQLAYIIVDKDMNIIKKVSKYIKDRIPSNETIPIHHITIDKLRNEGKDFYEVMNEFINDLKNVNYIVGHNIGYDIRVILSNLRKFELKIITNGIINNNIFNDIVIKDTYSMSSKSLGNLYMEIYDKPINYAHDALYDVIATFDCYKYLINTKLNINF